MTTVTTPQQQTAPAGDLNSTAARPEVCEWPEGDLPEQGSGFRPTLPPGVDTFIIPANVAQLWSDIERENQRKVLGDGRPNPDLGKKMRRKQLKFDRKNPLVVSGGPHDGDTMTATLDTNPRPRPWKKRDEPGTPWVSDLAFLLEYSLLDKSRPQTGDQLVAAINKYAGKPVRLRHGLKAQCRPDKVRWIIVETDNPNFNPQLPVSETNQLKIQSRVEDGTGQKGCGENYYTNDFKDTEAQPGEPQYLTEIQCDCGAVLRGFESIDEYLPPLGK